MARYPENPNNLFDAAIALNERARVLREEGWTVELGVAENGSRLYVTVKRAHACDPPAREDGA